MQKISLLRPGKQRASRWILISLCRTYRQALIKNNVEFPGVLVLGFRISEGCIVTQFCGVSRVKSCFVWNFQGQSRKPKNSGGDGQGVKKLCPQLFPSPNPPPPSPPLFVFFLEQPNVQILNKHSLLLLKFLFLLACNQFEPKNKPLQSFMETSQFIFISSQCVRRLARLGLTFRRQKA